MTPGLFSRIMVTIATESGPLGMLQWFLRWCSTTLCCPDWAQVYWHMPLSPDLKRQGVKSVSMCCQQVCHTLIGASVWAVLHQTKLNSRPSGINMLKCFVNCRKCLVGSVFFFPFYLMLLLLFSIFKHSEPVCTSHPQANTDASSPGCRQNHNLGNTELIKA